MRKTAELVLLLLLKAKGLLELIEHFDLFVLAYAWEGPGKAAAFPKEENTHTLTSRPECIVCGKN